MGVEYQLTQTVYLPKSCTQLDLQSMEASSLADLVISSTSLVNQRRNSKDDRIYRSGTPRRNINNETQEYRNTNWVSRLARITTGGVNHLQATGKIRIEGEILERMGTKNKGGVLQKEDLQDHLLIGHNKRGVQVGLRDHLSG